MSAVSENKRVSIRDFQTMKKEKEKIVMLTGFDYPTSRIIDGAGVNGILVGDSLGMTVLGYEDTTRVTMEDMLHHTKAVCRGAGQTLVVADMPFMSYQSGINEAVRNAGRLISEGGAQAVKLEGGLEFAGEVRAIIRAGIPVMGHIGVTPQSVHISGYSSKGRTTEQALKLIKDAIALQNAGVFSIVLECVPEKLASVIASKLDIPTIGIGSGAGCDGQILVTYDVLGLYSDFTPKFVKKYAQLSDGITKAVNEYVREVRNVAFPDSRHTFGIKDEIIEECLSCLDTIAYRDTKNFEGVKESEFINIESRRLDGVYNFNEIKNT